MKNLLLLVSISALLFSCKMNNGCNSASNNSSTKNTAAVKNFYDKVFNAHNAAMCDSFVVANFNDHTPDPGQGPGADGLKKDLAEFFTAFPDQVITISALSADSNTVTAVYNIKGTNTGAMMGMPATNKKIDVNGIDLFKFDNSGKITEHWGYNQEKKFMQQIGVMPSDSAMMHMSDKMMAAKEMAEKGAKEKGMKKK